MQFDYRKYLTETTGYIALAALVVLIVLGLFLAYARFLYRATNDPFTDKKIAAAAPGDFNRSDYLFVLKNLGYQTAADQAAAPAAAAPGSDVTVNPAHPDFANVKIQILNNPANGSATANTLKKSLGALGFDVAPVAATDVALAKTQIRVKDSIRANRPIAYSAVQDEVAKYRALDLAQTLEEVNNYDLIIVVGSAKPGRK